MKFLFDNNLSPRLARGIGALCDGTAQIAHIREKFPDNPTDVEWIARLDAEGDWAVVTRDRLLKNDLEKEALRRSGLVAFVLARGWGNLVEWEQNWLLVRWWPRIMEQAGLVTGGAVFNVPVKFTGKGRFEQAKL